MKYLLNISYKGTAYHGWQVQNGADTVQGRLNEASEKIFGMPCLITGCSRTDSGVHAFDYYATLEPTSADSPDIPESMLAVALNSVLPHDIVVKKTKKVSDEFHARYNVKRKEYLYRIYNDKLHDPFEENTAYFYPHELDHEKMDSAVKYLLGTHDFASYMASGSSVSDTVRTIYSASVCRNGKIVEIRLKGDGFLYNMVRIIVGTLIAVSNGTINESDIPRITESRDRKQAGMTVPACGLYLSSVEYE